MDAKAANFLDFLKRSPQFVIPIYQRTYSWIERECSQLWEDLMRTGRNDDIAAHFLGSVVYIQKSLYQVSRQTSLLVIDGQQRLTTAMLILEALARRLGDGEPVDGFSANKVRNYYLLNPLEEGDRRFKLLLTKTDKKSLLALMGQKPEPKDSSLRIAKNFAFFKDKIDSLEEVELASLCKGLEKLTIVDITLSRDHDNPQLIFESMNSTGRELCQADLIRNYVLMELEPSHQNRLYDDHWRPMEIAFGQEAYGTEFDSFMRHYLTFRTGEIPKVRAVYEAFKRYARAPEAETATVDALVSDIHKFANYYCAMALGKETDGELAPAFRDIRDLKVDVAFPFLLKLYDDYVRRVLLKEDFIEAIRLIEAYVFRRAVCAIPTNSLNKTFTTFGRALRKDRYVESMQAHFMSLPSYRRFPSDEEFSRELSKRDLYNFPRRSYWLRRLENYNRKEWVPVDEYTIEHIMPQNKNLSAAWQKSLGPEWRSVQERWLHTLGNLTLTGYNAEYGDKTFLEKRNTDGGFRDSPLRLNEGLRGLDTWNEDTIRDRAQSLADMAVRVWSGPALPEEALASLRGEPESRAAYTLDDHPQLAAHGSVRRLFDALRKAALALDPGISEEITKQCVAFKAETNIVDVLPQDNRLLLSLNLRFRELHDPKCLARNVTNLDRFGSGGAEVDLHELDELPYVMGLVRQVFEKQMGNDEADA